MPILPILCVYDNPDLDSMVSYGSLQNLIYHSKDNLLPQLFA